MTKIILITGGSRGIGAATAVMAAAQGFDVAVNYRDNSVAAEQVVKQVTALGRRAIAIKGDVAVEADVKRMFEEVDTKLGSITALVNNAGILMKQGPVMSMDANRLQKIFSVNAIGPFLCSREAVRRMSLKTGGSGGAIVNVTSTAIKQGGAFEYVDYAASKSALETLTIGLAKEIAAEGIRVNAVRPGIVYTEIHASGGEPGRVDRVKHNIPMQRGGQPEEVAKAILWLLSDDASFSTGAILDVSGGR
ncbi:MAG TPA: SDR family oxidoreductase [Ohtaekwangia sp.]|nr:SDR family oxidoreductase [Ohtaekwangia sp.]